jgi:hypothetical protein
MNTLQIINSIDKGQTAVLENDLLKKLPFEVKRMFFITGVPKGSGRGYHAHHKEDQFIFCVSGELKILQIEKDGMRLRTLRIGEGLNHPHLRWIEMEFLTGQEVILVLSSFEKYDASDYISDYEEFSRIIK